MKTTAMLHKTGKIARNVWKQIDDDLVFNGAAALAFFMMLSLFPAMIFLLTLIAYLPIPDLDTQVMNLLQQAMPVEAAELFSGVVKEVTLERQGGLLTFGILFSIWSVTNGIFAVMLQLNVTYDVKESRPFWKVRGIALLLMLAFVVLIIGAFGLILAGEIIQRQFTEWFGQEGLLLAIFTVIRWLVIALFFLLGLALTYYLGPDVEQRFRFITPGSVIGLILLVLSSLVFRSYISSFTDYSATYGSIGAVIALMLWLYLTGFVILVGSEINAVIEFSSRAANSKSRGDKKLPRKQDSSSA